MITSEIGSNAGKIWNILNEEGEQPVKGFMKKAKLTSPDFYMAVGWLAREGKIYHFKKDDGIMMVSLKG
jgi:glucan-binding YG repeat protein